MIFNAQSDVPAHEGPVVHGWIDTWKYDYPLSPEDAEELAERVGTIPALLDQARGNLVGNSRDLWLRGINSIRDQVPAGFLTLSGEFFRSHREEIQRLIEHETEQLNGNSSGSGSAKVEFRSSIDGVSMAAPE